VAVLLGKTCRVPFACTAPKPLSIEISVAFATDHRKVADWPRSMVRGSAVKLLIRAAAGGAGAGAGAAAGAGGGGAGTGAFFLHAATDIRSAAVNTTAPSVLVFIRILKTCLLDLYSRHTLAHEAFSHHRSQRGKWRARLVSSLGLGFLLPAAMALV